MSTSGDQSRVEEPLKERTKRSGRRLAAAAFLSFLWPGLGQAYRGEKRLALFLAAPPAILAAATIAVVAALGPAIVVAHLFNPPVAMSVIALSFGLAIWRTIAVVHAADLFHLPARYGLVAVVLLALIVLPHAWAGYSAWAFFRAGEEIFEPIVGADPSPSAQPSAAPSTSVGPVSTPGQTSSPQPSPSPLPGVDRRVTILLVGVDNTGGPESALTDTLIVASFDPADESLVMISLPRDTARLPLYRGGVYHGRVNSLLQAARRDPESYPDGPMGTLVTEMSYVTGIGIDYYAQVDIAGFTRLIDLVGGVDVEVRSRIDDPTYQFAPDDVGFTLEPGTHHLDGKLATAYARSRHGPGNSDYERARRQQQVLLALRNKLNDPLVLVNLPSLLEGVSQIIRTDAPLDRLPEIVAIAQQTESAATEQVVLGPPTYARGARTPTGVPTSANELNMDAVAELSVRLFGDDSRYLGETQSSDGSTSQPPP